MGPKVPDWLVLVMAGLFLVNLALIKATSGHRHFDKYGVERK